MRRLLTLLMFAAASAGGVGCSYATVEPGHRGLLFEPNGGGLQHETLQPGKYKLGWCFLSCTPNRVDDYDVTYSTSHESIAAKSSEGLDVSLKLNIIYRPIVSELYQLDTEIGPNYYDEVIGPEFRSACREIFSHHSYVDFQRRNEAIENEVEADVRRRTAGRHMEIASVTLEAVAYAPEIADKVRQKIAADQDLARELQKIDDEHKKTEAQLRAKLQEEELRLQIQAAEKKLEAGQEGAPKGAPPAAAAGTR